MPTLYEIQSSFPSLETAMETCEYLVQNRLIACANLSNMTSMYHWNQELQKDQEILLFLKTSSIKKEEAITALRRLHPYDLPAILWYEVECTAEYHEWIVANTSG
jgi:periplasmic divalent cation tolerance protein